MRKQLLFVATLLMTIVLANCSSSPQTVFNTSFFQRSQPGQSTPVYTGSIENEDFWQANTPTLWGRLQQVPLNKLNALQNTPDANKAAWIKIAIISKRNSLNTNDLVHALESWRAQYPGHVANQLFPGNNTLENLASTPAPRHLALLLPLTGKLSASGNAVRNGFLGPYYSQNKTGQTIAFYDTMSNPNIGSIYQEAISKGADTIIGPLTKDELKKLIGATNIPVTTLALNYTDTASPSNLYQFGLSPLDEAKQVADKAKQSGLGRALVIAPQNEWGQRISRDLITRWQNNGGTITDTYFYASKANFSADIPKFLHIDPKEDLDKSRAQEDRASLEQQGRHDYDVIFLLAPPQTARQIVPLLRFYYVNKTPIYGTSAVYAGKNNPQADRDLNGVAFPEIPWTLSNNVGTDANRLFAVGRDAYYISNNISRFTTLNNFPMYGATGALSLTSERKFYRRLAWTQFHNGHT